MVMQQIENQKESIDKKRSSYINIALAFIFVLIAAYLVFAYIQCGWQPVMRRIVVPLIFTGVMTAIILVIKEWVKGELKALTVGASLLIALLGSMASIAGSIITTPLVETAITISRPMDAEELNVQEGPGIAYHIPLFGNIDTCRIPSGGWILYAVSEVKGCWTIQEHLVLDKAWELPEITVGNTSVIAPAHVPLDASVQVFLLDGSHVGTVDEVLQCSVGDLSDEIARITQMSIAHSEKVKFRIKGIE